MTEQGKRVWAGLLFALGPAFLTLLLFLARLERALAFRAGRDLLREGLVGAGGGGRLALFVPLAGARLLAQEDAGELDGHVRREGADLVEDLEVLDGLDLQAGHGHQDELDVLGPRRVDLAVARPQEGLDVPADLVHVGGEDPARRDGLAHGLVVAVVAPDDHLVRDAGERGHVAPVLVEQEGQVLARLQVLLLDDVVVPGQRVHLGVVVGRRLHDLRRKNKSGRNGPRGQEDGVCLSPHDVLALPDVVRLQVGEQARPDGRRGVVVLVHKVHQVLRWVVLLPGRALLRSPADMHSRRTAEFEFNKGGTCLRLGLKVLTILAVVFQASACDRRFWASRRFL